MPLRTSGVGAIVAVATIAFAPPAKRERGRTKAEAGGPYQGALSGVGAATFLPLRLRWMLFRTRKSSTSSASRLSEPFAGPSHSTRASSERGGRPAEVVSAVVEEGSMRHIFCRLPFCSLKGSQGWTRGSTSRRSDRIKGSQGWTGGSTSRRSDRSKISQERTGDSTSRRSDRSKRSHRRRSESRTYQRRRRRSLSKRRGKRIRERRKYSRNREGMDRYRSTRKEDTTKLSSKNDGASGTLDKRYEPYKKLAKKLKSEKDELDVKVAKYEQRLRAHYDSERYEIQQLCNEREDWKEKIAEADGRIEQAQLRLRRCRGLDIDQIQSPEELDELFNKISSARRIIFDKLMKKIKAITSKEDIGGSAQTKEESEYWPLPPLPSSHKTEKVETRKEDVDEDDESTPPPPPPPLQPIGYDEADTGHNGDKPT